MSLQQWQLSSRETHLYLGFNQLNLALLCLLAVETDFTLH